MKMTILFGTILGSLLIYRFFCKGLCPLGVIYGLMNKVSIYHLEVDQSKCIGCGKCSRICMMDVDPVKKPDSVECIRCGKCARECPRHAITIGFGKKKEKKGTIG